MELDRWATAWADGRTRFHQGHVHEDLVRFGHLLGGPGRVVVPLCGKTLDLHWLVEQGHEVVGVEFVEQAIHEFFAQSGETPHREGPWWRGRRVSIVQADFFVLPDVGTFDAVWDRAALVAIDPTRREEYAGVVQRLLRKDGRLLLNAFEYDQAIMDGPPWSVPHAQVERLYPGVRVLDAVTESPEIPVFAGRPWTTRTYLFRDAS